MEIWAVAVLLGQAAQGGVLFFYACCCEAPLKKYVLLKFLSVSKAELTVSLPLLARRSANIKEQISKITRKHTDIILIRRKI